MTKVLIVLERDGGLNDVELVDHRGNVRRLLERGQVAVYYVDKDEPLAIREVPLASKG